MLFYDGFSVICDEIQLSWINRFFVVSAAGRAAGRERESEGGSSGAGRSSGEGGAGRRGRGRSERGSSRRHHRGGRERRQRDTVSERRGEMRPDREVC